MSYTILEGLNTELDTNGSWVNHTEDVIPFQGTKPLEADELITQDPVYVDDTNNTELNIKNKGYDQQNYKEGVGNYKTAGGPISVWDTLFSKIVPNVLNSSLQPEINSDGHPISVSGSTTVHNSVNVSSNAVSVVNDITHQNESVMVSEMGITNESDVLPFLTKTKSISPPAKKGFTSNAGSGPGDASEGSASNDNQGQTEGEASASGEISNPGNPAGNDGASGGQNPEGGDLSGGSGEGSEPPKRPSSSLYASSPNKEESSESSNQKLLLYLSALIEQIEQTEYNIDSPEEYAEVFKQLLELLSQLNEDLKDEEGISVSTTNLDEAYHEVLVTWAKKSKKVRFSAALLNDQQPPFEGEVETNNDQQSNIPNIYLNAAELDRAKQEVLYLIENRDLFEARAKVAELEQKRLAKQNRFLNEVNTQSLDRVDILGRQNVELKKANDALNQKNKSLVEGSQQLKSRADIAEDREKKRQNWMAQKKNSLQPARRPLRHTASNTEQTEEFFPDLTQVNQGSLEGSGRSGGNTVPGSRIETALGWVIPMAIALAVLTNAFKPDLKKNDTSKNEQSRDS